MARRYYRLLVDIHLKKLVCCIAQHGGTAIALARTVIVNLRQGEKHKPLSLRSI